MRILKKTDRTLILWQSNWGSPFIPLGAIALSYLAINFLGQELKLACYRATPQTGQCQIGTNGFFSHQSQTISLSTIQKVDLEGTTSNDDEPPTRILLVTTNGTIPVSYAGDAAERDELATQLAWFLETPTASAFKMSDGSLIFAMSIVGTMILVGFIYFLLGGFTIVKFSKEHQNCQVNTWRLWGKQTSTCSIKEVQKVTLEEKTTPPSQRMVLIKRGGEVWPLSSRYLPQAQLDRESKVGAQIENFWGL